MAPSAVDCRGQEGAAVPKESRCRQRCRRAGSLGRVAPWSWHWGANMGGGYNRLPWDAGLGLLRPGLASVSQLGPAWGSSGSRGWGGSLRVPAGQGLLRPQDGGWGSGLPLQGGRASCGKDRATGLAFPKAGSTHHPWEPTVLWGPLSTGHPKEGFLALIASTDVSGRDIFQASLAPCGEVL